MQPLFYLNVILIWLSWFLAMSFFTENSPNLRVIGFTPHEMGALSLSYVSYLRLLVSYFVFLCIFSFIPYYVPNPWNPKSSLSHFPLFPTHLCFSFSTSHIYTPFISPLFWGRSPMGNGCVSPPVLNNHHLLFSSGSAAPIILPRCHVVVWECDYSAYCTWFLDYESASARVACLPSSSVWIFGTDYSSLVVVVVDLLWCGCWLAKWCGH